MKYSVLFVILCFSACSNPQPAPKSGIRKELKTIITGSDKDKKGCISSAGYQWSELKKECVRPFEFAVQLSNQDNSLSAGLLFNADSSRIEIFCAESNGILIQKGEKWLNQDWELLFFHQGWTLNNLHSKNITYTSKNKI
ncbi:MAG: hypothetical protein V4561_02525 [Bacteroidota bacterium]